MTQKKPDRWERMIDKQLDGYGDVPSEHSWFTRNDVIKLLRKQHQAVVSMVLREFKVWATTSPKGYASAPASRHERAKQCRDILDKLKKMAT